MSGRNRTHPVRFGVELASLGTCAHVWLQYVKDLFCEPGGIRTLDS